MGPRPGGPPEPPTTVPGESRPAIGSPAPVESKAKPEIAAVEEHAAHRVPEVTVLRTAWHPSPSRRSTKLRMADTNETLTLKEGDAIGGLVVQEISPSAVLFLSGEIEIRLRVGQPGSGD